MRSSPPQILPPLDEHHRQIRHADKLADKDVVTPAPKRTNTSWLIDKTSVVAAATLPVPDPMQLVVEIHKENPSKNGFKLFSKVLDHFFMRYDSAGPAHYILNESLPLGKRQVMTPHIHAYADDGTEDVYRTKEIDDQAAPLGDIAYWLQHFCALAKISTRSGLHIRIKQQATLVAPKEDPLSGITF